MKKTILLLSCLLLVSVLSLTACNKGKQAGDGSMAAGAGNSQDTEAVTGEPFSELDFEEEVTIPLGENEDVGGL